MTQRAYLQLTDSPSPHLHLRITCPANPGASTAVCVIVGSSNVVAASLENIAHFRTRPDQKDPEKKYASLNCGELGGGRGLSNRVQHLKTMHGFGIKGHRTASTAIYCGAFWRCWQEKWAPRDAWLLVLDACGMKNFSSWNMVLQSSFHLPCIMILVTIFDLGAWSCLDRIWWCSRKTTSRLCHLMLIEVLFDKISHPKP